VESPRALKLALVTRRYPPLIGGAEKVLEYLAHALAAEGTEVTVVTSQVPESKLPSRERIPIEPVKAAGQTRAGSPGHLSVVRLETSRLRVWGTWRYMRNLKRWFHDNPVNVAYVSMLKHDAYVVVGARGQSGLRVVLRPEGAGATGDIRWQSWANFGRMIGLRCRRADAFVAISESIEDELRAAWQTGTMRRSRIREMLERTSATPRIIAIPNGVPIPEEPWQPRQNWQAAPRAAFVGRLAPEKGLDVLIDAWPSVQAVYPMAQLVLIGEGPERRTLAARADSLGLMLGPGQAVDLAGPSANPTTILRAADLFVLPSREEGMSIALLEAMALGMPVIASGIPGNQQLVADCEHGRLAPLGDPGCLAALIVAQWRDFDRAVWMGRAARTRVERDYSIQAVARKHLALFHNVVGH
jgi:glycosyltransferase involved in cell wall biosynthesis